MDIKNIDNELNQIDLMINKLKLEWDKFFGGGSKIPPWQLQKDIENKLKSFSRDPSRLNYAQNFRVNTLLGKFSSIKEKNEKLLRMKEEGYAIAQKSSIAHPPISSLQKEKEEIPERKAQSSEGAYKKLFDEFLEAKKKCGEPVDRLKYELFEETLEKQKKQIYEKVRSKEIEFYITIENGKAKLKARPKR